MKKLLALVFAAMMLTVSVFAEGEKPLAGKKLKIALSAKDCDEMGETLVERANKELNAHYTLAGEAADIRAGLVLISKECDVNCSFETLLALSREKTERGAAKLLFAE